MGRKVRDAELARVPYMLVLGDREHQDGAVAVRSHEEGDLGTMSVDELEQRLRERSLGGLTPLGLYCPPVVRRHATHLAPLSARRAPAPTS